MNVSVPQRVPGVLFWFSGVYFVLCPFDSKKSDSWLALYYAGGLTTGEDE